MRVVAAHLENSVRESFEKDSAPETGKKWAARKESILKTEPYRKQKPKDPLKLSSKLFRSITSDYCATEIVVGTNSGYAATHQFEASKDRFGTGSFKSKARTFLVPWGDLPAQPFLGVWDEHEKTIIDSMVECIEQRWQG